MCRLSPTCLGSVAWAFAEKKRRQKLDAKTEEGVVIGCFENIIENIWIPEGQCANLTLL